MLQGMTADSYSMSARILFQDWPCVEGPESWAGSRQRIETRHVTRGSRSKKAGGVFVSVAQRHHTAVQTDGERVTEC